MMSSIKLLGLVFSLFTLNNLLAQQDTLTIVPGDKLINGSFIESYTNKWKVTYITADGNTTPNRIWTDYGQVIELENKKYLHRVQDLYDPNMKLQNTWINMVELETLIPVSFSTINPKGNFSHYVFEGNKVSGSTNLNKESKTTEVSIELKSSVYDWNLYGMLLVGLPLGLGSPAKLPYYNTQSNSSEWIVVTSHGEEEIALPGGKKVKTQKIIASTGQRLTFWLSKQAPYVIKLELALKDGAKLVWDMY